MRYAWVRIFGNNYVCKIVDYSETEEIATILIGGITITNVPLVEFQPVYNSKLPWEA